MPFHKLFTKFEPCPSINLLDQVLSTNNLNSAWVRVRANKGASGIDGMTIDKFLAYFQAEGKGFVEEIRQQYFGQF
jgi:RNA-directed DNA polymerase